MKKIIVFAALCMITLATDAQDYYSNMDKYWNYRQRLINDFVVVSPYVDEYGVNLPAEVRYLNNGEIGYLQWDDNNSNLPHYISVLATEYRLLKNNGQDYSQTLKELFYVMYALERRDLYSEHLLKIKNNVDECLPGGIPGMPPPCYPYLPSFQNGFFIRDDVTEKFWKNHYDYFGFNNLASDVRTQLGSYGSNTTFECMSQDNVYHLMEGLALVSKLVDDEDISSIYASYYNFPNFSWIILDYLQENSIYNNNVISFKKWANDIIIRMAKLFYHPDFFRPFYRFAGIVDVGAYWYLDNPVTGYSVEEGNGKDLDIEYFYNYGLSAAVAKITGYKVYDPDTLGTKDMFIDLFQNDPYYISYSNLLGPITGPLIDAITGGGIPIYYDNYKIRTLGTMADALGSGTFNVLRDHRLDYPYEHFPLIYYVLYRDKYPNLIPYIINWTTDRAYYLNLLNQAPANGPDQVTNYEWSCGSRLVAPEARGLVPGSTAHFAGLDYMLEFNLFYLCYYMNRPDPLTFSNVSNQNNTYFANNITANGVITNSNLTWISENTTLNTGFSANSSNSTLSISSNEYFRSNYLNRVLNYKPVTCYYDNLPDTSRYILQKSAIVAENDTVTGLPSGKNSFEAGSLLAIFPNPGNGIFTIMSSDEKITHVRILNTTGQVIWDMDSNNERININLLGKSKGVYIVLVSTASKNMSKKLIIN